MMASLLAGVIIVLTVWLFGRVGVIELSQVILRESNRVFSIFRSVELSDLQKEKRLQKASLSFLALGARLVALSLFCVLAPYGLAGIGSWLGGVAVDDTNEALTNPWVVLISLGVATALWRFANRKSPEVKSDYSPAEQMMYQLAFHSSQIQIELSGLEDRFYRKQNIPQNSLRPVFIAGLPRAGTTLLLETLGSLPEFASHTYRHLPFLFTPLWWNSISKRFHKEVQEKERAHKDGIQIKADSPEAFEEMIWKGFWPDKYELPQIPPWTVTEHPEFQRFFSRHMAKIVWLQSPESPAGVIRYLSKNNGNIARLSWILKAFPDAKILIPFRDFLPHAESLLRQHRNFSKLHESDPFSREYMEGIGHFDFGQNLKPIDFGAWHSQSVGRDPMSLPFWLDYWNSTYLHLLSLDCDRVGFMDYSALCRKPKEGLQAIGRFLELRDVSALENLSDRIRNPKNPSEQEELPFSLISSCQKTLEQLRARAINSSNQTGIFVQIASDS